MVDLKKARFLVAMLFTSFIILVVGCVTEPALQREVTTEYLLTTAGFQRWDVNMETPKRQALLNGLPKGKISTYMRNGQVYHVYPDEGSNALYIGDEAAYQRYQSRSQERKLCERVTGPNQVQFWSCMEDYARGGAGQRGK